MNLRNLAWASPVAVALSIPAAAEVRVVVHDQAGVAWIQYLCTAGETPRAFALDVRVDRGEILGITNFFVGPSRSGGGGYGIFPASFRDSVVLVGGTSPNWASPGYSPLAVVADNPADTQPGLGSPGVTLEFGALWDPTDPSTAPPASGNLCALLLSQPAQVSVAANVSRGGVVLATGDPGVAPAFSGGAVGPLITGAALSAGQVTLEFHGGELQTAPAASGPWTGTGDMSGAHHEPIGAASAKFYRVLPR